VLPPDPEDEARLGSARLGHEMLDLLDRIERMTR